MPVITTIADLKARVAAPAAEAWVADNAAKGVAAQELLDLVTSMAAER